MSGSWDAMLRWEAENGIRRPVSSQAGLASIRGGLGLQAQPVAGLREGGGVEESGQDLVAPPVEVGIEIQAHVVPVDEDVRVVEPDRPGTDLLVDHVPDQATLVADVPALGLVAAHDDVLNGQSGIHADTVTPTPDVPTPNRPGWERVMSARPGFFPNGQCRHYQLVDGWAKVWCVRTDEGHTEHETANGVRWAADRPNRATPVGGDPSFGQRITVRPDGSER